jgi:serine phosphatase RsbU (regulator of sigma subunit)
MFLLGADGTSFQNLWPNKPYISNHSLIFFLGLTSVFIVLFSRTFLRLKEKSPVLNKVSNLFIATGILLIALSLSTGSIYTFTISSANLLSVITVFFILITVISIIQRNETETYVFTASFVLLLIGTFVYVLRNSGVIPNSFIATYSVKIGVTAQIIALTFAISIRFRSYVTQTKAKLEKMVKDRTVMIEDQKDEIKAQRDFANKQKEQIQKQNKEIKDSIRYAKRIQTAMMPSADYLNKKLENHFIFYRPRDIVSGDFYWASEVDNKTIIVCADCTGHGVPGGFLSVLGISSLNEIVKEFRYTNKELTPDSILKRLSEYFLDTLGAHFERKDIADSIDMGIVILDKSNNSLDFSGAKMPLYVISDGKLSIIKGDKLTVGINHAKETIFKNNKLNLKKDDLFYMFSDGYIDQIGGSENKTYKSSRFRSLLTSIHQNPMDSQADEIKHSYLEWKGFNEQTDDILVIGVKL